MKKALSLLLIFAALLLCACSTTVGDSSAVREIRLTGESAESRAGGVSVKKNVITISAAGTYSVTGELTDGQIVIDTGEDAGKVDLILDHASVTNLTGPALWVKQAKKLDLIIAGGTTNTLTSGTESDLAGWNEDRSGGAIYAEDDIDVETEGSGDGKLFVYGYLNSGILCKDDVEIKCGGCLLSIKAANNGVKGSESVTVSGGQLRIDCGKDGIKSSSAEKEGKGFVEISGGAIDLNCSGDGISAETVLRVSGGAINVTTTGDPDKQSCKGLKGKTGVELTGGAVTLSSNDHAIHSAAGLLISDGSFTVESAAKGISAHGAVSIGGGALEIRSADDALECYGDAAVTGGSILLRSGADGIKTKQLGTVRIEDGCLCISAAADAFDTAGELLLNGGEVLSVGRAGAMKGVSENSTAPVVTAKLSGGADTEVALGELSFQSSHSFDFVIASSPALNGAEECELILGGTGHVCKVG